MRRPKQSTSSIDYFTTTHHKLVRCVARNNLQVRSTISQRRTLQIKLKNLSAPCYCYNFPRPKMTLHGRTDSHDDIVGQFYEKVKLDRP
ncbi:MULTISPECIES: hypothetical protein [unclassified Microcoleus]|uniref:hypothetical protein n=1 Tax=unclassified Microcoleus TaxID=2642155 RepID=UPI002FD37D52